MYPASKYIMEYTKKPSALLFVLIPVMFLNMCFQWRKTQRRAQDLVENLCPQQVTSHPTRWRDR